MEHFLSLENLMKPAKGKKKIFQTEKTLCSFKASPSYTLYSESRIIQRPKHDSLKDIQRKENVKISEAYGSSKWDLMPAKNTLFALLLPSKLSQL